jgi:hypothetical protein
MDPVMEAIAVYVCPTCNYCTVSTNPTHHSGKAECLGIPYPGVWVPNSALPAAISPKGMVDRLVRGEVLPSWMLTGTEPEPTIDPAQKDDDRQTVVKPQDGDDRYFDDEQEKLGR